MSMNFWKKSNNQRNNAVSGKRQFPIWIVGVLIGACFLMKGALDEQFADIYRKAIMICLECIGIG